MQPASQNFFHADYLVSSENTSRLKDGFHESGLFVCDRAGLGCLKVDYKNLSGDADAPVALILHGYRGAPNGPNNVIIADILQNAGFATAQIGFAGYDHYGECAAPQMADRATIPSNIEDVSCVLDAIDPSRKVLIVGVSASINVALPAARANVSHIIGSSPFPNIVTMLAGQIRQRKFTMPEGGYLIDPNNPMMKITDCYLKAGQPVNLRNTEQMRSIAHKPRLMVVRADADYILPKGLVGTWLNAAHKAGYVIEDFTISSDAHEPNDAMFDAIKQQVDLACSDLNMR